MRLHPLAGPLSLPWSTTPARRWSVYLFAAGITIYLAMAIALSLTRMPWWDEGVLADPAWQFATRNTFGSTCVDESSLVVDLPKVREYTFWQSPAYLVLTGLVFKITGASVVSMRMISVVMGVLFLFGWRQLLLSLSDDENLANIAAAVIASDYSLLTAASNGRMDLMCAAGGIWSLAMLAAYARKGRAWMLFASSLSFALSVVSHPASMLYGLCWLVLLLMLAWQGWDWRVLFRPVNLLLLAMPPIILLGLWGTYILQDLDAFRGQLKGLSYRVQSRPGVLKTLLVDLTERYVEYYFQPGFKKVKGLTMIEMGGAVAAVFLLPALRHAKALLLLALLAVTVLIALAFADNQKMPQYLVHTLPFMGIVLSAVLFFLASSFPRQGSVAAGILALVFVAISLGGNALRVRENVWKRDFDPVIRIIQPALDKGGLIMGGSELGLGIGFTPHLIDDRYLGMLSGKVADYFVIDEFYYPTSRPHLLEARTKKLRDEYQLLLENPNFKVYRRK